MQLYGRAWTRRELEARVGRIEQLGGVQRVRQTEGRGRDVEQIQVRTGSGLTYDILPDRGMDISLTAFAGVPLSWQAPNGDAHPAYYDDRGENWLRSATGGLLMTCGMRQVGNPNVDEGEELGLHGRMHHTARARSASPPPGKATSTSCACVASSKKPSSMANFCG